MSEKDILREIKEIFFFLTEQEPTPDDEIEAKEKLIEKFKILKNLNSLPDLDNLIEDTLNKLENWETLDYWFNEFEGLAENIEKIINISEGKDAIAELKGGKLTEKEIKIDTTQIDISEIVAQISGQLKEEINSLKGQIKQLQRELGEKEKQTEEISQKIEVQEKPPIKEFKLTASEINIPFIKRQKKK